MPANAERRPIDAQRTPDVNADSGLERDAYEYVMRHVDPELLPEEQAEAPGAVGRAFDALTRDEENVALAQGALFVATGVWPLLHMPSFEAVTGPKTDRWLVKTVGALVTVAGGAIASAALRRRITPETRLLALASSLALTAVDVVYTRQKRISRIYLLDAVTEAGLVVAWLTAMGRQPQQPVAASA